MPVSTSLAPFSLLLYSQSIKQYRMVDQRTTCCRCCCTIHSAEVSFLLLLKLNFAIVWLTMKCQSHKHRFSISAQHITKAGNPSGDENTCIHYQCGKREKKAGGVKWPTFMSVENKLGLQGKQHGVIHKTHTTKTVHIFIISSPFLISERQTNIQKLILCFWQVLSAKHTNNCGHFNKPDLDGWMCSIKWTFRLHWRQNIFNYKFNQQLFTLHNNKISRLSASFQNNPYN